LLIVDDEEGPRQSLKVVFEEDYNLLLASDGLRAIELAKHNKIDAAVLDIRMSGMSGIELLERLKAVDPNIEIIMLTAYEAIETIRQALRLGACDYLNKPFDITTLRMAVANAIDKRSLSDEMLSNNRRLAELQSELQNHKMQEEITRTRGEIYASIIHDINGPLTIISGFIQILIQRIGDAKRVEGEDLELVKDRLRRITRQVSNCIAISQRYLSFLRQQSVPGGRVRVNQLLTDLEELLKAHPSSQNNTLRVQQLAEDVSLQMNVTDLMQILLNLSINAFQSTAQPHNVEIHARLLSAPVNLAELADRPSERTLNRDAFQNSLPLVVLAVQDNGPGIPADVLPKIFEPYFTTKSAGKGTGLGLSIVQRLVKEAQGLVQIKSEPGKGTVFNIFLPAQRVG
jgi:signal transduction histidine kinase